MLAAVTSDRAQTPLGRDKPVPFCCQSGAPRRGVAHGKNDGERTLIPSATTCRDAHHISLMLYPLQSDPETGIEASCDVPRGRSDRRQKPQCCALSWWKTNVKSGSLWCFGARGMVCGAARVPADGSHE